jgi:hypothetical protein
MKVKKGKREREREREGKRERDGKREGNKWMRREGRNKEGIRISAV